MLLFETLAIAILGLVPGQSPTTLGVELVGVGGVVWLFAVGVFSVRRPAADRRLPVVVNAGRRSWPPCRCSWPVSLVARCGGGLHWLVLAIVLLLAVGVMNAWALLIEILC